MAEAQAEVGMDTEYEGGRHGSDLTGFTSLAVLAPPDATPPWGTLELS